MQILITGAAGGVGRSVTLALSEAGHRVVGFDRIAASDCHRVIQADLLDRGAVRDACEGCDVVIHLAATPDESDFVEDLLQPNVLGLFHVCDAARHAGCKRLVLASSLQVVWGHLGDKPVHLEDGPRVVNHYALTKLWAEDMGEMYARCFGLSVIAARLGWLPRSPSHHEELKANPYGRDIFLSHRDAGRFFLSCVEAPMEESQFEALFATSKPAEQARVDLSRTTAITGYEPEDIWPEGLRF